jgi:hypothetical protein
VGPTGRILFLEDMPFDLSGPTFNVKDYGGKADGRSDDTSPLLAAYRAASVSGERTPTLYFPAGNWRISAPLIIDRPLRILVDSGTITTSAAYGIVFRSGARGSSLAGRNGFSAIRRAGASTGSGALVALDSASEIRIAQLELDGNGGNISTKGEHFHGLFVASSSKVTLKNLYVHDNQGDAIDLYGAGLDDVSIENTLVRNLGRAGLDLTQLTGVGLLVRNFACIVGNRIATASSKGECVHSEPAGGVVRTSNWRFSNLFLSGAGIGIASNTIGGILENVSLSEFSIVVREGNGISIAGAQDVVISDGDIVGDTLVDPKYVAIKITELAPSPRTGRIIVTRTKVRGFNASRRSGAVYLTSSGLGNAQSVAPVLSARQTLNGHLVDGVYSYTATSIIDGIEYPAGAPVKFYVKNGGGRAAITLTWQPPSGLAMAVISGYRIYGRDEPRAGALVSVPPGPHPGWTDDGTAAADKARPPQFASAYGHVTLGPALTIDQTRAGSGIYIATPWPYVTITGDTIRHSGDRCIAFNSGAMHFAVNQTECSDYSTIGLDITARDRSVEDGRITDNRFWTHNPAGKTGIRLPSRELFSQVVMERNELSANAVPVINGRLGRMDSPTQR